MPSVVYVVGDVHGCLQQMRDLEARIVDNATRVQGTKLLVYVGDVVDRGPNSAGVLDHLLSPEPPGFERIVLCGNHELMFLDFLYAPSLASPWLTFGGRETLLSYGIEVSSSTRMNRLRLQIETLMPSEHRTFLETLPVALELPCHFIVHAGIDPARPLSDQRIEDMTSIRRTFLEHRGGFEKCIVHGNTPVDEVQITADRIGVDTGAYGTGRLSAVRLVENAGPQVLSSDAPAVAM